jgi:CheY-like chemotaxis protein
MRKRLLIVDDDPDILEAVCDVLVDDGYLVTPLRSAEAALELLADPATPAFAAIVLDNLMPGLTGVEFIEKIVRPDSALALVPPILIITTNPGAVRMAELPTDVWLLAKPIDIEKLIDLVREITSFARA